MTAERATGLILRTNVLTETSIIVKWLTREHGRLSTVAKGARRPKSPFQGRLDLFYTGELSFSRSRRSSLHTLREVRVTERHAGLREDWRRLQQASYCALLLETVSETDTPIPELHDLLLACVRGIATSPPSPWAVLTFELRLLDALGMGLRADDPGCIPPVRATIARLLGDEPSWSPARDPGVGAAGVSEIASLLAARFLLLTGRLPKARAEALSCSGTVH